MAFPPQYRESASALPAIRAAPANVDRLRAGSDDDHHGMAFGRSPTINIPGSVSRSDVPPALPPPPLPFGQDHYSSPRMAREDHYRHKERQDPFRRHPSSATSGFGSMESSYHEDYPAPLRRRGTDSTNEDRDEGYASYASTERSQDSLPSGFVGRMHQNFQFKSSADDQKNKLFPIRTNTDRSSPISLLSSSINDVLPRRAPGGDRPGPTLQVPTQLAFRPVLDSPARISETPLYSAVSPIAAPFSHPLSFGASGRRSPAEGFGMDRSPRTRMTRNNSDDATSSIHGGYDYSSVDDMDIDDDSFHKRSDDMYASVGQKRKASPSAASLFSAGLPHRRDGTSRGSPTPRLTPIQQGSSLSALSPAASLASMSRSNSYMSSMMSSQPSSAAPTQTGRRSPSGLSPNRLSPTPSSPYTNPASLNTSPKTSAAGRTIHSRNPSGTSPPTRKMTMQKPGGTRMQGFYMCECCPKKPKKFDTAEELSAHEAEKQYGCSYCGNRFKNKNEAERHQNSLHVRRHSWSCSALSAYERAFHESTSRPGEADTCGYCGDDFPRTGPPAPGGTGRQTADQDWDERSKHLQEVHKFRECNAAKKFFRADHFRQHLKHSHAGTSGKWTNMLETACMIEEEPDIPLSARTS